MLRPLVYASALAVLLSGQNARGQCAYEVTVLDYPIACGFGGVITSGISINEEGAVAGYYRCSLWEHREAFVWTSKDGYQTLERTPGVASAVASDINDEGSVCGTTVVSGLGCRGFLYQDGIWTELPPAMSGVGPISGAAAINNDGVVVGKRSISDSINPTNAFVWSQAKGFTDLGVMNGPFSAATDVNDRLQVVGWTGLSGYGQAFLWEDGEVLILGPIPGGCTSAATAVNSQGQIVGSGLIDDPKSIIDPSRGFFWENGQMHLVGWLIAPPFFPAPIAAA